MLEKIKIDLGISHNALDTDITDWINACILDLGLSGVTIVNQTDALIIAATKLYCRWQYDYMGKGEQYEKAYSNLKNALALCGDYNAV